MSSDNFCHLGEQLLSFVGCDSLSNRQSALTWLVGVSGGKAILIVMRKMLVPVLVIIGLSFFVFEAHAEIYRYRGEGGEIVVSSEPIKGLKLIEVSGKRKRPAKRVSTKATKTGVAHKRSESQYDAYIGRASKAYDIPVAFIKAVIKIESNFNPMAVSSVGAQGLMQLMPATAASMGVQNAFDPLQNIMGGTKYLRRLADRYDGDINLVLSAYHAGPGNVDKYGGIPFEKTQQYVKNVYRHYLRFREQEDARHANDKTP